jgi:hypothetical protein
LSSPLPGLENSLALRAMGEDMRGGVQTRHDGLVSDLFANVDEIPARVKKYEDAVAKASHLSFLEKTKQQAASLRKLRRRKKAK